MNRPVVFILFFLLTYGCTYIGPGIYHTVLQGETVWDISTTYNCEIEDIISANRLLNDPNEIKPGQKIYMFPAQDMSEKSLRVL
ncbi:MAG: LysM domain-containing protein [Elusimicrobiota bacterium]